jgi:hypothetical protein
MDNLTSFMSASATTADSLLQLSLAVSREAYLAYKEETPSLSVPCFMLHADSPPGGCAIN